VRGLEGPIVVKKKSKLHLGSVVARAFREGVDDESESFTHPYDGVKKVGGYMDWMIARVSSFRRSLPHGETKEPCLG